MNKEPRSAEEAYALHRQTKAEELKSLITEWDSYLPKVKRESLGYLVETIIDLIK